jgi:hypothetical protein
MLSDKLDAKLLSMDIQVVLAVRKKKADSYH